MQRRRKQTDTIRIFVQVPGPALSTDPSTGFRGGNRPFEKIKHLLTHWPLRGRPNRRPGTPP